MGDGHVDETSQAASAVMASAAIEQITAGGQTCEAALEALNPPGVYDKADGSKVLDTAVKGDKAKVTVKYGGGPIPRQFVLVIREDDVWKVHPFGNADEADEADGAVDGESSDEPEHAGGRIPPSRSTAMHDHNFKTACSLLSSNSFTAMSAGGLTCEAALAPEAQAGADQFLTGDRPTIDSVKTKDDDHASVTASRPDAGTFTYVMVREDGTWKYDLQSTYD